MRWFVADLRTGRQVMDVPVMAASDWSRSLNKPESISAVLDMQDPATIALRPRQTMAPGRTMLACAVGDVIIAAGPIWSHDYSRATRTLTLTAAGLWSYFDHRYVLPIAAATLSVGSFVVPDPAAAGKTMPNSTVGTYLANLEYGTIAKRWVQQAQTWTGGNVPVVFEADRVGTHERNFEGADFKNLGTVLSQLSAIEGGPDIRFQPQFTADRLGVQFALQTGTDAEPLLAGAVEHLWDMSIPKSPVSDFDINVDATRLAGTAWATAGRSTDSVLVSRAIDPTLTDLGYALFETLDATHSTVERQATLDGYAREAALLGATPVETWTLTVEANRQPYLGAYWEGDFCTVRNAPYDVSTGRGDSYLFEGGDSHRRITAMSGDALSETVKVHTQAVI